jgi:excisionase family DNA binding protein
MTIKYPRKAAGQAVKRPLIAQGGVGQDYLDVPEAAALLNRTEAAIYRLVARRQIPHRKYGRRLIFKRSELERLIETLPGVPFEELKER